MLVDCFPSLLLESSLERKKVQVQQFNMILSCDAVMF